MLRLALALGLCAGLSLAAVAQPAPAPPAAPVDIRLTGADQGDVIGMCALAMRSPAVNTTESIIILGEFCAKLRNLILDAHRKAAAPPAPAEPPKE